MKNKLKRLSHILVATTLFILAPYYLGAFVYLIVASEETPNKFEFWGTGLVAILIIITAVIFIYEAITYIIKGE